MLMALMTLSLATVIPLGYFLCTVSVLRTEVCPQNLWICDLTGQEEFCRCDQEWWDLEYAGGLPVITRVIAKEIPSFCVLSLTQGVTCKRCSVSLSEWTCVSRSLIVSRVDFYNSLRSSVTILSLFCTETFTESGKDLFANLWNHCGGHSVFSLQISGCEISFQLSSSLQ